MTAATASGSTATLRPGTTAPHTHGDTLPATPIGERSIIAFCCRECAYAAADTSANARTPLPPSVRLILLPCTGRVSPLHLLSALAEGADGVMVAGCLEGQCHYREGNFNAIDRVKFVQRLLESVGVEPERCRMFTMSAGEPPRFVAAVKEMDRVVGALPPLVRRPAGEAFAAASAAARPASGEPGSADAPGAARRSGEPMPAGREGGH
ncbi:MAG: hydrogenase iron-sulfur subunit [Thermoleophilia bacterium]|nr:hydrogenase iron-sulfur subunit [Thermoleophilia bacterium]